MTIDDLTNFWGDRTPKAIVKRIGLHILIGIVLGTIGPYDSSNIPGIAMRFSYWVGLLAFGALISQPIAHVFFPWFKTKSEDVKLAFLGFCALMSVPIFFAVLLADILVVHIIFEEIKPLTIGNTVDYLLSMPFGLLGYILLYGQVLVVAIMAFGAVILLASDHRKLLNEPTPQKPAGLRFLNRLPANIGTNLICLEMEDHYVRAHTAKGSALVLMRLADAIEELSDYPGMQVHRSWWVSYGAIQKVSKEKRRYFVHLLNDIKAPVSQTHIEKLRERDYI